MSTKKDWKPLCYDPLCEIHNPQPSQPKPEVWTADSDGVLLPMHRFVGQYAKEIADAHNAALAQAKEGK